MKYKERLIDESRYTDIEIYRYGNIDIDIPATVVPLQVYSDTSPQLPTPIVLT